MRGLHSTFAILLTSLSIAPSVHSQIVTNWAAYNDNVPTPGLTRVDWPITAPRVTGYTMGDPGSTGNLTNFYNGQQLPVIVTFTLTGAADNFGTIGRPVPTNTPMARLFYGICDLSNDGI